MATNPPATDHWKRLNSLRRDNYYWEHEPLNIEQRATPTYALDSGLRRNDDVHFLLLSVVNQ